jgi:hypothetical protein
LIVLSRVLAGSACQRDLAGIFFSFPGYLLSFRLVQKMPVRSASGSDGVAFDPFSFRQDGLTTSEVDVGRG